MVTLIVLVLFGIVSALFATQNTTPVSLVIANYTFSQVPLYLIVLIALLIGLFLSFIISLVNDIFFSFTIRGKDTALKSKDKTVVEQRKEIHKLQLENAKLKEEQRPGHEKVDEKSL